MVKHIVFWNFRDNMSDEEKENAFNEIKESLEKLPDKIAGLEYAEAGYNNNPEGCDLSLYTILESKEALEKYQVDPVHVEAASVVKKYVKSRWVVDYESVKGDK